MPTIQQNRPAYEQIAQHIRHQVLTGELGPGDRVPSQADLLAEWGVHKATANKAVALLKTWGVVETKVGSGTRVAALSAGLPASSPQDMTDRMLRGVPIYAEGERSEIYEATVMSTEHVGSAVLQAVGLPSPGPTLAGESTTIIKRARRMYRDDRLTGVCTTWINHPLVAQQPQGGEVVERLTDRANIPGGTGRMVTNLYGLDHTHDACRVGVRPAPLSVARELLIEPGTPMLWVLCTRYAGEHVIEVDEWFRTDDLPLV